MNSTLLVGYFPDAWVSLWSIWWAKSFVSGSTSSLYHTPLLYPPAGTDLYLHNLVESLTIPAALLLGNIPLAQQYNLLCVIVFLLNFFSAFVLFGSARCALKTRWLFSLLITFHPFILGHLAGGHLNLMAWFPIFLLLWFYLHFEKKEEPAQRMKRLGGVGLIIVFAVFTDWYLFYFSLLLSALFIMRLTLKRGFKDAAQLVLALLAALAASLPKLAPAIADMSGGAYTRNHSPFKHSADLIHFMLPHRTQQIGKWWGGEFLSHAPLNWAESGCYVGMTFILLFLFVLRAGKVKAERGRFWVLVCGLLFLGLALGPDLQLNGSRIVINPLYRTAAILPFVPPVPARFFFAGFVMLLLWLAPFIERMRPPIRKLCLLAAVMEFFPVRPWVLAVPHLLELSALREDDHVRVVLDLGSPEEAMYRQILHQKPMFGGFIARRPKRGVRSLRALKQAWESSSAQFCRLAKKAGVGAVISDGLNGEVSITKIHITHCA